MNKRGVLYLVTVMFLFYGHLPSSLAIADETKSQGHETVSSVWKGIRISSPDGAFDIRFGGRIMNDWSLVSPEKSLTNAIGTFEDGSEIRRAWVHTAGTVYRNVVYKAMYAFEGGDVDLLDMYVGLKDVPYAGLVRVGHIREPFGMEQQTSCNDIMFLERSTVHELLPFRSIGAVLQNAAYEKQVTWALGLYRDSNSYGVGTGDHSYSLVGRITTAPVLSETDDRILHLGMGINFRQPEGAIARYRSRPGLHLSPYLIDTGNMQTDTEKIINAEIAAMFGAFSFQHETFVFMIDGVEDYRFISGYVQGSWCLNGSHRTYDRQYGALGGIAMEQEDWYGYGGAGIWEIAARYSRTGLDDGSISGGELGAYTLGLNWYVNPAARWMVNYIHADREDSGNADILATRIQVRF